MPGRTRRLVVNFVNAAIPWLVGAFLVLVVLDEGTRDATSLEVLAGIVLATIQAIALYWRRSAPERVTVVVLVSGLFLQLLFPSIVVPFAGLFAIGSLAAARPPRVSLIGLAGLIALSATNFHHDRRRQRLHDGARGQSRMGACGSGTQPAAGDRGSVAAGRAARNKPASPGELARRDRAQCVQ